MFSILQLKENDTPTKAQTIDMYCFSCFTAFEYNIFYKTVTCKKTNCKRDKVSIFPQQKQN